jgi:thiosulfate dehydrogenase [quinone] large subunit
MTDILGWLTVEQWLAFLRIAVGLWWLESVRHKNLKQFLTTEMVRWSLALADSHPVPAYGRLLRRLIEPNARWFPYLIVTGEFCVGLGLTLGLLTPLAAATGLFMNLNYVLLAGVPPRDLTLNPGYEVEQGQNFMMMAIEVVVFVLAAGCTWGVDGAFGLFCGR